MHGNFSSVSLHKASDTVFWFGGFFDRAVYVAISGSCLTQDGGQEELP